MARKRIRYGKFLSRLILIAAVIYGLTVGARWFYGMNRQIQVSTDSTQVTRKVSGYILRNETKVFTPNGGAVSYFVQDGDSVQKGQKIAEVLSSGEATAVGILSPQQTLVADQIRFQAVEQEIANLLTAISDGVRSRKLSGIPSIKSDLAMKLEDEKKLSGEISALQNNLKPQDPTGTATTASPVKKGQKVDIISPGDGVVSFFSDGLEDTFVPTNYKTLNLKTIAFKDPAGIAAPQVKPGALVFKLADVSEWYLAVPITPADRKTLEKVHTVSLKIDQESVQATVLDIQEQSGSPVIVLQIRSNVPNAYKVRKLDAEIILNDYKGISVPVESVIPIKNVQGVIRIEKDGSEKFVPVEVLSEVNGRYILTENTFYTQDGSLVRETATVKQGDHILGRPGDADLKQISVSD